MLRGVTIIQARTTSSRLPGKALLPVGGYPSAVLAALRAANRGQETILATSDDASDDELARVAQSHGICVFRGSLHDVLGRYYFASSQLSNDCAVVRLTADNVVPDGDLVKGLTERFSASGKEYISIGSGLPYGVAAEVFSVAALHRAQREAVSEWDREHVTPWIVRNCSSATYDPPRRDAVDRAYLRCTIDDEEDYNRIVSLFEGVSDPVQIGWEELVCKLTQLPGEPAFGVPYRIVAGRAWSQLTLGTAQLGMEYGRVNDHGKPNSAQAVAIVRRAITHGVTAIDTARAYGTAEEVVGQALRGAWASRAEVVTKLDLTHLHPDASASEVRECVDESVNRSCQALGFQQLSVLLLHRWEDRHSWHGEAWRRLLDLRDSGKIAALGASVYETREALEALEDPDVEHLQIPLNVLDWRWEAAGVDRAAAARPEVVVHARSALLQGILAHPASRWPVVEGFHAEDCRKVLDKLVVEFGRESVTDLCLAYVRSRPWVTSTVLGCETMEQLEENLRLSQKEELSPEQCERLRREMPAAPEALLNPSRWKPSYA
jgi:aryl-alcohol dehydrogenase-like predicted oxidoreductase/spore coat polysaccharide biosynthesis protein SpsF (cytidylyltransferase family)